MESSTGRQSSSEAYAPVTDLYPDPITRRAIYRLAMGVEVSLARSRTEVLDILSLGEEGAMTAFQEIQEETGSRAQLREAQDTIFTQFEDDYNSETE